MPILSIAGKGAERSSIICGKALIIENHIVIHLNVPHPFSDDTDARLFKTGDRARYLPDGNILFLGRMDEQIKIGGIRIEPGEIETALEGHPDVEKTIVLATENTKGARRLTAYITFKEVLPPPVAVLRFYLKQKLPESMVPSAFVYLDEWPLKPNGKLDRQALPKPQTSRPDLEVEYVAPRNPVEEKIASLWKEVLGLDTVGIHDNFFDLGGASLQAIQIYSRAVEEGYDFNPEYLFEHQTIAQLSDKIYREISGVPTVDTHNNLPEDDKKHADK